MHLLMHDILDTIHVYGFYATFIVATGLIHSRKSAHTGYTLETFSWNLRLTSTVHWPSLDSEVSVLAYTVWKVHTFVIERFFKICGGQTEVFTQLCLVWAEKPLA